MAVFLYLQITRFRKMKLFCRSLLLASMLLSAATGASSQNEAAIRQRIAEDPEYAASVYYPYVFPEIHDTPAPKGFKAFYISHYGRHGSRHQAEANANRGYNILKAASEAGILSDKGKEVYADVKALYEDHIGQFGDLSPRGVEEHRTLARRMKKRFPTVFSDRKRRDVFCLSSNFPRCLMSMTSFTTSLQKEVPELNFDFVTGDKYFQILAHDFYKAKEIFRSDEELFDSLVRVNVNPERIMKEWFIHDDGRVGAVMTDTTRFIKGMFTIGAICGCIDYMGIQLFSKYFTTDELTGMYISYNNRICGNYGNTIEFGDRCNWAAKWLLEDFVTRADRAIQSGSTMAADLRFGHDTGIMPLAALIGLDGFNRKFPRAEAHKYFDTSRKMPMGTNLQMIFYRNKKGNILVKFLYNEEETTLPAVPSINGVYYDWNVLRAYLEPLFTDKTPPQI